jgi:hypothetical protein
MLVAVVATAVVLVAAVVMGNRLDRPTRTASAVGAAAVTIPLTSSMTTAGADSVVLPMGDLHDPTNTFWELFVRPSSGPSWVLRTPPGVADNGGLSISLASNGYLGAGFMPSALLKFSPLAASTDGGHTWLPGELPGPLPPVPNALAVDGAGSGVALISGASQSVVAGTGNLSTWKPLRPPPTSASTGAGCSVDAVSAVATTGQGSAYLGLGCTKNGRIGIEAPGTGTDTSWQDVGPRTAGVSSGSTAVLRLEGTSTGLAGLAEVATGSTHSVIAFWGDGQPGHWAESPSAPVPAGWSLMATGVGGGTGNQGSSVLLASGRSRRVEVMTGPGGEWRTLPDPPEGTSAVTGLAGEVDAFVASGASLTVWSLPTGDSAWRQVTSITVPIQYGSSG